MNPVVDQAIESARPVGVVGLLGALYSGIGWMTNLREALSEQWGAGPGAAAAGSAAAVRPAALLGLGVALVGSFAITGLASGFAATRAGRSSGWPTRRWAQVLLGVLGVVLGLAANWLIFLWVIARLPREHATLPQRGPGRGARRGRLRGAQAGHDVLPRPGHAVAQRRGVRLVPRPARVRRTSCRGSSCSSRRGRRRRRRTRSEAPVEVPGPAVIRSEVVVGAKPSGGTTAGLLGAGAAAGALGALLLAAARYAGRSPRPPRRRRVRRFRDGESPFSRRRVAVSVTASPRFRDGESRFPDGVSPLRSRLRRSHSGELGFWPARTARVAVVAASALGPASHQRRDDRPEQHHQCAHPDPRRRRSARGAPAAGAPRRAPRSAAAAAVDQRADRRGSTAASRSPCPAARRPARPSTRVLLPAHQRHDQPTLAALRRARPACVAPRR